METRPVELPPYVAVVLAGGTARRLGGTDKATLEVAGRTLLDRVLDAVEEADTVVVVGDPVPTSRTVRFVREEPAHGGPAAALMAGRDALGPAPHTGSTGGWLVVVACDMPRVTPATAKGLIRAATGRDGAVLTGPDGRRQLAMALDLARLDAVSPRHGERDGLAMHRLLAGLRLVEVAATGEEHRDVDTWDDVRELST